MTRPTWDEYFFDIAKVVATRATCPRRQVGAVLVRDWDHRIVSMGYNGASAGLPHCTDIGCYMKDGHCVRTVHAEENALQYLGSTFRYEGFDSYYTLYCTLEPCRPCITRLQEALPNVVIKWLEDYP